MVLYTRGVDGTYLCNGRVRLMETWPSHGGSQRRLPTTANQYDKPHIGWMDGRTIAPLPDLFFDEFVAYSTIEERNTYRTLADSINPIPVPERLDIGQITYSDADIEAWHSLWDMFCEVIRKDS